MFSNVIMLAGIGGAVLPLVLHCLGRARCQTVPWGAMMFLPGAEPGRQNRTRVRQFVLLFLRMATVALLAVALARPVLKEPPGFLSRPGSVAAVFLLDRSASMGTDDGGQSRLELAKRAALGAISRLNRGDEVALVLIGDDTNVRPQFTTDLQRVASQIVQLKPSAVRGDVASGLADARRLLRASPAQNRLLLMATDRQASGWEGVTPAFLDDWTRDMANIDFVALPVGATSSENIAVMSIRLLDPPCVRGNAARFEVVVRNFGGTRRAAVPLTLSSATEEIFRTTVDLAPYAMVTVQPTVRFESVGSQVVSAAVASPDPGYDNTLAVAVDVVGPIRVLVVSGAPVSPAPSTTENPRNDSADFLKLALSPYATTGAAGADPATVEVVPIELWPDLSGARCDVVVLANIAAIPARQVRSVERFIYSGGGVLVAPGNLTRVDSYNATTWRDGSGFLPAPLEPPAEATPTSLMQVELAHPIFESNSGWADPLPGVSVKRYFPVFTIPSGGRAIASYRSGEPFLIDRAFGKGRVLLVTTPLDVSWSNLPLTDFYLPFMQSAVRYLSGGNAPRRNLDLGQPIETELPGVTSDRAALYTPDARQIPLDIGSGAGKTEVRFADTFAPGRYEIRYATEAGERTIYYVVRGPGVESDPTSLSDRRWNELASALQFKTIPPDASRLSTFLGPVGGGLEIWPLLLAGVAALGFLELLFARRWSAAGEELNV